MTDQVPWNAAPGVQMLRQIETLNHNPLAPIWGAEVQFICKLNPKTKQKTRDKVIMQNT